jgi:hypothetical protein
MGPGAKSFGRHQRSLAGRLGLSCDPPPHVPAEILPIVVVDREGSHVLVAAEPLHRPEIACEVERGGDRRVTEAVGAQRISGSESPNRAPCMPRLSEEYDSCRTPRRHAAHVSRPRIGHPVHATNRADLGA